MFVCTEWYPTDILLCFCFVWNTYLAEYTIVGTQQLRRFFFEMCTLKRFGRHPHSFYCTAEIHVASNTKIGV